MQMSKHNSTKKSKITVKQHVNIYYVKGKVSYSHLFSSVMKQYNPVLA